jgi:hypothetical protein
MAGAAGSQTIIAHASTTLDSVIVPVDFGRAFGG